VAGLDIPYSPLLIVAYRPMQAIRISDDYLSGKLRKKKPPRCLTLGEATRGLLLGYFKTAACRGGLGRASPGASLGQPGDYIILFLRGYLGV
jgi:hypothetical protein